ncbi:MAG: ribosome assembly RNA-binding protein YhbY [Gammaproteobacteria bacterium]
MSLTPKSRQALKAKAHKLKPIVFIGHQGLTDAVKNEVDRALYDHELIKVRIQTEDRETRRGFFADLCSAMKAEGVQMVGKIGIIYRESDKHL